MKIRQVCLYRGPNFNLLPAILLTSKDGGFIIAFKFWNFHFGVWIEKGYISEIVWNLGSKK